MSSSEDFLDERTRAQDILLGALGFGEDAKIITISQTSCGYSGTGVWPDGDTFEFESTDEPSDLEIWALEILKKK